MTPVEKSLMQLKNLAKQAYAMQETHVNLLKDATKNLSGSQKKDIAELLKNNKSRDINVVKKKVENIINGDKNK